MVRQLPFARPSLGDAEKQAMSEVLSGHILTHGPKCAAFEARFAAYFGVKHAVTTSNCTTALHLALVAHGVGPGDEVIVPAMTHVATAHVVEHCGAKPVFADVDPATGNISPGRVEQAITPRTKAIMVVHYLGLPCDMDAIMSIAAAKQIPVVEDSATALGASYAGKSPGAIGAAGCYSFYPTKHITTLEGGMLVTNSDAVAAKVRNHRAFGYDKGLGERSIPGIYDIVSLGWNYRMSEGHAAVGLAQMDRLPGFLAKRCANADALRSELAKVGEITVFPFTHGKAETAYYCVNATLPTKGGPDRNDLILRLNARGVGTSVHYPLALPLASYYRSRYGATAGDFPVAEWIAQRTISLPCGPHLDIEDMVTIGRIFIEEYEKI